MNINSFSGIIKSFSDDPDSAIVDRNQFVVTIRDETLSGTLQDRMGELYVSESGSNEKIKAERWILDRVARISSLADRIISVLTDDANANRFVDPGGLVNDVLDYNPEDKDVPQNVLVDPIHSLLNRKAAGCTTVLYLVSDAGEGKSTIINKLAIDQARRYKSGEEDWLILPVALGGRTMLRLDDVVSGAIGNTYRFPFLFYQSLLELVRMNVVVLALDGFEEMFVENSPGDAASSLGSLLDGMKSSGSILIASRKAYFDFKGMKSKSKLYDTVFNNTVQFGKISINKWDKVRFLQYAALRGVPDPERIYNEISVTLGGKDGHPLLTRPVLVEKLIDIAVHTEEFEEFLGRIRGSHQEFVFEFMRAIIVRETNSRWVDRDGLNTPITSVDEHFEMLEGIALEMWLSGSQIIRQDLLDMAIEMTLQAKKKEPRIIRSAIERIKQHALMKISSGNANCYEFDHEDFFSIFLGRGIARVLCGKDVGHIAAIINASNISVSVASYVAGEIHRLGKIKDAITSIQAVCKSTLPTSFARENGGSIIQHLMVYDQCPNIIDGVNFSRISFGGIDRSFSFSKCRIVCLDLDNSSSTAVSFDGCSIESISLGDSINLRGWRFFGCDIFKLTHDDLEVFDPQAISITLAQRGVQFDSETPPVVAAPVAAHVADDERLKVLARAMRVFFKATEINENVFRVRLGAQFSIFIDEIVPELRSVGALKDVTYTGSGNQSRFKIIKTPSKVLDAVLSSKSYEAAIVAIQAI